MSLSSDILSLTYYALRVFTSHGQEFAVALGITTVLAAGCWWAASHYSRLWNLRFQTTTGHHILCLLAAVCTLVFALLYASLKYTKEAADLSIDLWGAGLPQNDDWLSSTRETAYLKIKELGREDPTRLKELWEKERRISLAAPESQETYAEILARATVDNFHDMHPFLSKILRASSSEPAKTIAEDMTEFFRTNPSIPAERTVNIAAETIKKDLHGQTDRVVPVARTVLVVLFVVVQLIPFGIIGYAAHRDLKVTT